MKAENLKSLERTMMVRWICGVSLKDRKHSEDLCSLLGIQCAVVKHGRLRFDLLLYCSLTAGLKHNTIHKLLLK